MDVIYDLDKDWFRIFTLDRNNYLIVLFKCEAIEFYIPLSK